MAEIIGGTFLCYNGRLSLDNFKTCQAGTEALLEASESRFLCGSIVPDEKRGGFLYTESQEDCIVAVKRLNLCVAGTGNCASSIVQPTDIVAKAEDTAVIISVGVAVGVVAIALFLVWRNRKIIHRSILKRLPATEDELPIVLPTEESQVVHAVPVQVPATTLEGVDSSQDSISSGVQSNSYINPVFLPEPDRVHTYNVGMHHTNSDSSSVGEITVGHSSHNMVKAKSASLREVKREHVALLNKIGCGS